ncbi:unnamed protein product, partial [Closterium sp. NIES-54]
LFERMVEAQTQLHNYKNLVAFTLFTALYLLMLCLQAQSFQSYQVASAHSILLPPDYSGDSSYSFASSSDFYTWLNNSIIQVIWSDPQCGDGTCTPPTEFPAVGRFGCAQDCGNARNVTTVTVALRCHFTSREAMLSSSWNLCSTAIRDVCWFQDPQQFTELTGWYTVTLRLPDNDWFVSLTAPSGGVGVYVYESLGKKTSASEPGSSSGLNGSGLAADGSSQSPPPSPPPPVSTAPAPTPFQPTSSSSSSHSSAFPSPPPASATSPSSSASSAPSLSTKEYLRPSNGTGANVLLASVDGCVEDGESGLQRCRQTCAIWTICLPQLCTSSSSSSGSSNANANTSSSSASSSAATSLPMRVASAALGSCFQACNAMLPGTAFDPPDNITCSQAFTLFEASLQTPSCSDMLSESPAAATPQPPTAASAPAAPAVSAAVETPKATSSLSARLLLEPSAPDEHPMSSLHPSWPAESLLNSRTGMASVHLHHQQLRQKPREERTDAPTLHAPHKSSLTASTVRSSRQLFPSPPTSSFIPATSSQQITEAQRLVWESLGTMDSERIRACQVAVARALYTAVKENCLAGRTDNSSSSSGSSSASSATITTTSSSKDYSGSSSDSSTTSSSSSTEQSSPAKSLSLASRNRLVALLCTLFAGPFASHPRCNFTDASSGRQLTDHAELVEYIRATHRSPSRRFSAAQQALFVRILIMALQSVVQKMPSDAVQAATHLLHIFNDAVVSPDASPCPQADYMVLWDSASFTRRVISDGQRVTWVWNDDDYHELSGSVGSEPFLGFGAGRLGLSRLATCAWDKIGPRDASDEPAPCVL